MSLAYKTAGREEKGQITSFFHETGHSYSEINEIFKLYNVNFCCQNTFTKLMKQINSGEREIEMLEVETRNKFIIKREELVQCIFKFCYINSEPSPEKTCTLTKNSEKLTKYVIKVFYNKSDLWNAFCDQRKN